MAMLLLSAPCCNCSHETWRGTLKILFHSSPFATLTLFISFSYSGPLSSPAGKPNSFPHITYIRIEGPSCAAFSLQYRLPELTSPSHVVICFYSDLWGLTLQVGIPSPLPPLFSTKGIPNLIKKSHIHLSHYCHLPPTWSNHCFKRNNDDECLDGKSHDVKTNFQAF